MSYPERIASEFVNTCGRLAPAYGVPTRDPWDMLSKDERELMVAVVQDLRARAVIG